MLKNILNFSGTLTTETTTTPGEGGSSILLPDSSLDNEVVRFNGTTGTSIQGSNVFINDTQGITGAKSLTISTGATNPGSDTTLWVRDSDSHLLFGAVDLLEGRGGSGGTGAVVGAASSTDNAIARFDGTTGKLIQNSGVGITDTQGITNAKYLQIIQSSANPGDAFSLWFNNVDSTLRFGTKNLQDTGGDVFSSESITTDNRLVRFDGTGGKTIQDSIVGITDAGVISGVAGTVFTNQSTNPFDAKTLWLNSSNELFFGSTELTNYITTPAPVVDNFIPRWNGTTGRNIQSSLVSISDAGAINIGNSLVKGYLSIEGNPAQYLDLTNNIVAVGRSIGTVSSNSVLVGTSGASFASNNSVIVGNNSCQSAFPSVVDLLCFGNNCGSGNGSKTIAIGNRISPETISSSLGADNIIMGHDVDVRNSTSGNVIISNSSRLQGLRSVVVGTNNKVNGNDNLVMGYNTLSAVSTDVSSNNVLLGSSIIPSATSASGCVIIGSSVGSSISSFLSNCLWIEADGVNGETNTTRIGKSTKTNCYITGIHGSTVGNASMNVRVDTTGKMFGSAVGRVAASMTQFGYALTALTTTPIEFTLTPTFILYADTPVFSMPANGRILYNGIFSGDVATRRFRVSFNQNVGANSVLANVYLNLAKNGILIANSKIDYYFGNTLRATVVVEDFVSLNPGDYVSMFMSSNTATSAGQFKYSMFIELLS